jgi:hypothetical protein
VSDFARGARIKKPLPLDQSLTLVEASFVMCAVAERHGITDLGEFLKYMTRALISYRDSAAQPPLAPSDDTEAKRCTSLISDI